MKKELFLILHNIRSAHNVGSLFRTADGMGVVKIFLTGYTPTPIDRFNRKDPRISKISLGAEDMVPWEQNTITDVITSLKEKEVQVLALEQTEHSIPLHEYKAKGSVALIVGNEVEGVPEEILEQSDVVLEIPMKGKKESLNVSNAGSIALFHLSVPSI